MAKSRTTSAPPKRKSSPPTRPSLRMGKSGLPTIEEEGDEEHSRTDQALSLAPISVRSREQPRLTVMTGVHAGLVIAVTGDVFLIGRGKRANLRLDDPGVSRHHTKIVRSPAGRFLLEDTESTNGTLLNGRPVKNMPLERGDRIQIGPNVVLQFSLFDEAEEQLANRLYAASTRDALTGAYNRRFMEERLTSEVPYAKRHRANLAAIMIDVDHFKKVNDLHGHAAGDAVLRAVATRFGEMIRAEDMLARYGGEEFFILTRADLTESCRFAERLRTGIEALEIPYGGKKIKVTVSAGVAEYHECGATSAFDAFVLLADKRLYVAKQTGRNRVIGALK